MRTDFVSLIWRPKDSRGSGWLETANTSSSQPFAPEPQVAKELAKRSEQKTQTQGNEKHRERQDQN